MKMRHILAVAALVLGMGTASVAKADTCASQAVITGMTCSLGDLTFTFLSVTAAPGSNLSSLDLETPSTGFAGGVATLDFEVLAATPVDIHLVYEVASTSADITSLDSGFNQGNGTPAGSIVETGCAVNPMPAPNNGICPTGPPTSVLATFTNNGGTATSDTFGPVETVFVDKDVTDNGFSSFVDSVDETTTPTPEPSSIALFGTGMLAAAGVVRRRLVK